MAVLGARDQGGVKKTLWMVIPDARSAIRNPEDVNDTGFRLSPE